ncbi:MAG: hypothetical protein HFJ21_01070 [Clostridia bacterium]|jgi:hypothetical protein|nr:hypothetical protein [Clostridia bacterium]
MGAGGIPSGGVSKIYGRLGSLPRFGAKPNSRIDLYNENGVRIQSRWYDSNGIVFRNRDYTDTAYGVHDHLWSTYTVTYVDEFGVIKADIMRSTDHLPSDYFNFPSDEV